MPEPINIVPNGIIENAISLKKPVPIFTIESFTAPNDVVEESKEHVVNLAELIQRCEINLKEVIPPPPVAMQVMSEGTPITLFTKGNFSIVAGPPKSRKSFLVSMFMAAAIKGEYQDLFFCDTKGLNILFDTEQSKYKVQQIARRIVKMAETDTNIKVFHLRTLKPVERIQLIEEVLKTAENLNLVIIDGIIDLQIDPILQADQAQLIIQKLMEWTEIFNIHIICVLHYNKSVSSLLGHLGSFAHRKADAIIEVTKCKESENVSLVKAVDCREKEFSPFAFSVDDAAIPHFLEGYDFEKQKKEPRSTTAPKRKQISPESLDHTSHTTILNQVFAINLEYTYDRLWRKIKQVCEAILEEPLGDNKSKNFITYYLDERRILKTMIGKKATYIMAKQTNTSLVTKPV